jgi:hypothetical protein
MLLASLAHPKDFALAVVADDLRERHVSRRQTSRDCHASHRELRVAIETLPLPCGDIGYVGVVFVLVKCGRIVIWRAKIAERNLARIIRDLEGAVGRSRDHAKAR